MNEENYQIKNIQSGRLFGISGYARTGKDTLCRLLGEISEKEKGQKLKGVAFAEALKNDLNSFLQKNFGFNSYVESHNEKKLIRPIMVAYGEAKRSVDQDVWIKKVEYNVKVLLTMGIDVCITDVRYENEAKWLNGNGILINISRDGIVPPNASEIKNHTSVLNLCDARFKWEEAPTESIMKKQAEEIYKEINVLYNNKFKLNNSK